jgi:hypothetical protein
LNNKVEAILGKIYIYKGNMDLWDKGTLCLFLGDGTRLVFELEINIYFVLEKGKKKHSLEANWSHIMENLPHLWVIFLQL